MAKHNGTKPELHFDLTKVTAGEIANLQKALRGADTETCAGIYARTITHCPPEWGDPSDPQTYLNLPYFGEFQDIVDAWFDAGKNVRASLRGNSGNT